MSEVWTHFQVSPENMVSEEWGHALSGTAQFCLALAQYLTLTLAGMRCRCWVELVTLGFCLCSLESNHATEMAGKSARQTKARSGPGCLCSYALAKTIVGSQGKCPTSHEPPDDSKPMCAITNAEFYYRVLGRVGKVLSPALPAQPVCLQL